MDKMTAGLLGAVAGLATMGAAQAAPANPAQALHASSYAELLDPVANPVAALQADDAARATEAVQLGQTQFGYQPVNYNQYYGRGDHHHHHHHNARRWDNREYGYNRRNEHHHHHHHNYRGNNNYIGIPGVGGVVVGGRR